MHGSKSGDHEDDWLVGFMFQKINFKFGGFYSPVFSIRVSQDFVFWPIRVTFSVGDWRQQDNAARVTQSVPHSLLTFQVSSYY